MDGVSIAASIVGIATAGVQVSIKLVTLATQISTASDRVSSIGNDISLTSSVLHQLGELMNQRTTDDRASILNQHGLETIRVSAAMCEKIFQEVEKEVARASEQLRRYKPSRGSMRGGKIELSTYERAKWPFLQPNIDTMRADLRDAKSTLMLMLQVASLALSKRMADASMSASEYQDFVRAIVALELERREEGIDPTRQQPSSSNDIANIGKAAATPGEGTLNPDREPQTSASLSQAGSERPLELKDAANDSPNGQAKGLLDPVVSPGIGGSQNQNLVDPEIQLFLLKPTVKDLFDTIELRWSIQNTNMRPLAIREHMAKNEKDDLPSVVEMLQQLHAHEQSMVDSLLSQGSGDAVIFLQRTKTDIQLRDMHFKAIPGLQFVVQRRIHQPTPRIFGAIERVRRIRRRGLATVFAFLKPRRRDVTEVEDARPILPSSFAPSERMRSQSVQELDSMIVEARTAVRRARRGANYPIRTIRGLFLQGQMGPPPRNVEQQKHDEEAEAEALVTGLLGRYTTLFDS